MCGQEPLPVSATKSSKNGGPKSRSEEEEERTRTATTMGENVGRQKERLAPTAVMNQPMRERLEGPSNNAQRSSENSRHSGRYEFCTE